jgi:voltage-gated potassium channel
MREERSTPKGRTWRRETKTLLWVVAAILLVVLVGTGGYMVLFGWSFLDALYQTVTTISTVGFTEVRPLSSGGRVFTMLLILSGVGVILYGLGTIVEYAIKAQLSGVFKRRAVRKQVDKLENHYIICGYGRVGESVARHFASQQAAFVIVDNDPASLARAEGDGFLVVEGDATNDEALETAGIKRAKGVVAAVGSDAGNVYVTLSARVLNPLLLIVARASSEDTMNKLKRAGADRVVSPYGIGGRQMAVLMLRPLVSDYLDVVTGDGALEFRVEELQLTAQCCAVGRSIKDLSVRKTTGATILAVRRGETGVFDTNPSPETVLESGDTIIAIGTPPEITSLEELVGATRVPREQGV